MPGRAAEVARRFGAGAHPDDGDRRAGASRAVRAGLRHGDRRAPPRSVHRDGAVRAARSALGVYSQPVTDITGALLARVAGPVAAYNWLVLLSFPLSAAAAYLLARHLALSPAGAASPRSRSRSRRSISRTPPITRTSRRRSGCRCISSRCGVPRRRLAGGRRASSAPRPRRVTLSNFYGGLIAAVITPVAVGGLLARQRRDRQPGSVRRLARHDRRASRVIAAAGLAYACVRRSPRSSRTARRSRSRATICSATARNGGAIWFRRSRIRCSAEPRVASGRHAGVGEGLLEQQVSLGWGVVALGIASSPAVATRQSARRAVDRVGVPVLVVGRRRRARVLAVAGADDRVVHLRPPVRAALRTSCRCSGRTRGSASSCSSWRRCWRASAWSGSAAQDTVRAQGRRASRCVVLAAGEYAVWPPALWRDVLPTDSAPLGDAADAIACRCSTARRSTRSPRRFSG